MDFKFDFKRMNKSVALYDIDQLNNISHIYISLLKADKLYEDASVYFKKYDPEFYELFTKDQAYSTALLNIEREIKKPRKDIASYKDIKKEFWYMYDSLFIPDNYEFQNITNMEDIKAILDAYVDLYDETDDKDTWFNKCKELCDSLGYASDMKAYKENPENFKGNVADVTTVIRVALTSRAQTPDLYELLKLLGKEKIKARFTKLTTK